MMKRRMRRALPGRALLLSVAALVPAVFSGEVAAIETARLEGFGPISRGFAGGGSAFAVGAAAMMLNPAELLSLDTDQELMLQLTHVMPTITVRNSETGERVSNAYLGDNRGPYDLPEVAYARRIGDWAFGAGVFAAGGFGIEYGTDSFLSRTTTNDVATGLPVSTRVAQLRIPLAIAWKPAPRWRVGASLDIVNASMNLASLLDVQQVGALIQSGRATGSLVPVLGSIPNLSGAHFQFIRNNAIASELAAWGLAGRVGASFQLNPATVLAATYEFESRLGDLDGRGTLTAVDSSNNHITLEGKGALPEFQFPQAFVLGLAHRFSPTLAMVADVRRTMWAQVLGDTVVSFQADDGGDLRVALPTGFNNLTTLGVGVEWQFMREWTLRAGGTRALQPVVPGDHMSGTFPTLSRNHLGTGLSYQPSARHQFDAGVTLGFTRNVRNPGNTVNSVPPLNGSNMQVNAMVGYSYHF